MTKVLVVDDEESIRKTVEELLTSEGYEVILAENGKEGLKLLDDAKPELVILDIMMPGLKIETVVKRIKDTKILFLTNMEITDAEKKGILKQENVAGIVEKPFHVDQFLQTIRKVIRDL